MKYIFTPLLLLFLAANTYAQNSCTYSDIGSSNTYILNNQDVLCIESGIFTGIIANFSADAEIRVAHGAMFQPAQILNGEGFIVNNGFVKLNVTNVFGSGIAILNDSGAVFEWNAPQDFTGTFYISNQRDAEMHFNTPFNLNNQSTLLNEGNIVFKFPLVIGENCVLSNEGVLFVNNNLEVSGTCYNSGIMKVAGFTLLDTTASYINKCTYYCKNTITNHCTAAENFGYIHIYGGTEEYSGFTNHATFYNDTSGIVQSYTFDNYGEITGSGTFAASHLTRNYGTFGADAGGINFYDMTPTGSQIFDVQVSLPDTSVSAQSVSVFDTNYISMNCNQMAFPNFLEGALPVVLSTFQVTAPNCLPLIFWTTSQEKGASHFDIERKSVQDYSFATVGTVNTIGNSQEINNYSFTDQALQNGNYQYRLKMVDQDGHYTYSHTSNLEILCDNIHETHIYPVPASELLNISLNAFAGEQYRVSIYDITGREMLSSSFELNTGIQTIPLSVTSLTNGTYFLKVSNGATVESFKFMKN